MTPPHAPTARRSHRRARPLALLGALLALALAAAGCGSSSKPTEPNLAQGAAAQTPTASTPAASTPAATPTPTTTTTPAAPANPALAHKPVVARPKGPAPKTLQIKDLVTGTGAVAKAGSNVTVQYVGVLYSNGQQFDASWDRNQPLPFQVGVGAVIPGWDKGIPGMKVGGRRELIIPAALAYGAAGSPPKIGPNQPLIFVVDLLSVQ
jgi:peptidylprolyl isomerase